MSSCYIH